MVRHQLSNFKKLPTGKGLTVDSLGCSHSSKSKTPIHNLKLYCKIHFNEH